MIPILFTAPDSAFWERDATHFPFPMTRYFAEVACKQLTDGFAHAFARYGVLLESLEHISIHGFMYMSPRLVGVPIEASEPPPAAIFEQMMQNHPEILRRRKACKQALSSGLWRTEAEEYECIIRPHAFSANLALQSVHVAALSDEGLVRHLEDCWANSNQRWFDHARLNLASIFPLGLYIAQVQEWTGVGQEEAVQAVRCVDPEPLVAERLATLQRALQAKSNSDFRRRIADGEPADVLLEALRQLPGDLGDAARAWLELVAYRLVTGFDIVNYYYLELPDLIFRHLCSPIQPVAAPNQSHCVPQEQTVQRARLLRDAVPDKHRAEFDTLLKDANRASQLREQRALVTDLWAMGLCRRALLEAGRRLWQRHRLSAAEHFLEASHAEALLMLQGSGGPSANDLEQRWSYRTSVPLDAGPECFGRRPPPPPFELLPPEFRMAMRALLTALAGVFAELPDEPQSGVIRGLAASRGVYEGYVCLANSPAEANHIAKGDILVATATNEGYNAMLSLVGAIVTDRGGMLCHAATVAREFGIPAVVGTKNSTRLLTNGVRVRVDGTHGKIEILPPA